MTRFHSESPHFAKLIDFWRLCAIFVCLFIVRAVIAHLGKLKVQKANEKKKQNKNSESIHPIYNGIFCVDIHLFIDDAVSTQIRNSTSKL